MSTTGPTAAARALKERQRHRNLPTVEVPRVKEDELARTLHGIQEHLRMYEGDSGAPKERFVTIAELENSGLIKADVKSRFAYISQVLETDVAQMAGSTSNPTTKNPVPKDTSRTSRTPGGGSAITQADVSTTARLSEAQDVDVTNPAKNEFLYFDGNKFTNFPLFQKNNVWAGRQRFEKALEMREQVSGPVALEGLGYVWIQDGTPNTLWFTNDAGAAVQLGVAIAHTHVIADVTDFTDNSTNWDTAYGWGDHASGGYADGTNEANWNTAYGWGNHASGGYEPAFSKNSAFNDNYGTGTGTVCQGNDSRLSDARTPTAHNQAASTITSGVFADARLPADFVRHVSSGYNSADITVAASAPGSPSQGDIWFDTS